MKRLTHTGSTLRARDAAFKGEIATALREKVWPALEAGTVKPVIDSTFPLDQISAAFAHQISQKHFGKICLEF